MSCINCELCSSDGLVTYPFSWILKCRCNENLEQKRDWNWQKPTHGHNNYRLSEEDATVLFHPNCSTGTAVVRGDTLLDIGLHYWELKVMAHVYGTDIIVGIGTSTADLSWTSSVFVSALGLNNDSWGFSYRGFVRHDGQKWATETGFRRGNIIGCLLDTWHGTFTFFIDGQPLPGGHFSIPRVPFYPYISSTAAKSGFRLIHAKSSGVTLQALTCMALRKAIHSHKIAFDILSLPPGLQIFLKNNMAWLEFTLPALADAHSLPPLQATPQRALPSQSDGPTEVRYPRTRTRTFTSPDPGVPEDWHPLPGSTDSSPCRSSFDARAPADKSDSDDSKSSQPWEETHASRYHASTGRRKRLRRTRVEASWEDTDFDLYSGLEEIEAEED